MQAGGAGLFGLFRSRAYSEDAADVLPEGSRDPYSPRSRRRTDYQSMRGKVGLERVEAEAPERGSFWKRKARTRSAEGRPTRKKQRKPAKETLATLNLASPRKPRRGKVSEVLWTRDAGPSTPRRPPRPPAIPKKFRNSPPERTRFVRGRMKRIRNGASMPTAPTKSAKGGIGADLGLTPFRSGGFFARLFFFLSGLLPPSATVQPLQSSAPSVADAGPLESDTMGDDIVGQTLPAVSPRSAQRSPPPRNPFAGASKPLMRSRSETMPDIMADGHLKALPGLTKAESVPSGLASSLLQPGAKVTALFTLDGQWYPAEIRARIDQTTFIVWFPEWEQEASIGRNGIRVPNEAKPQFMLKSPRGSVRSRKYTYG